MPTPKDQYLTHRSLKQALIDGTAPWNPIDLDLGDVKVYLDRYPVTEGHKLFVPEHDAVDAITEAFRCAMLMGMAMVGRGECDSFNVGINMGEAAGQTVMYPHVHLIPRRHGDTTDPTGGVRGVIAGQANYRSSTYKK